MMNYLTSFYKNKYLFTCPQDQFDDNIKPTLLSIFSCDIQNDTQHVLNIDNNYGKRNCIICLHNVCGYGNFIVCDKCCDVCLNKDITIEINTNLTFISHRICYKYQNYWIPVRNHIIHEYFPDLVSKHYVNEKYGVLAMFVDNSHKLIHRFYHTTLIIFLMTIYDTNSSIYVLHMDIIKYICNTYVKHFFY